MGTGESCAISSVLGVLVCLEVPRSRLKNTTGMMNVMSGLDEYVAYVA